MLIGIITYSSHLYYDNCIITDLELCFQSKYTSSDIVLNIFKIPINNNNNHKIQSIETQQKPKTLILNASQLEFVWETNNKDTGIHAFE